MTLLLLILALTQDAGVPPVREKLNQLLDEACELHGCDDAGTEEDSNGRFQ